MVSFNSYIKHVRVAFLVCSSNLFFQSKTRQHTLPHRTKAVSKRPCKCNMVKKTIVFEEAKKIDFFSKHSSIDITFTNMVHVTVDANTEYKETDAFISFNHP